jgi:hypothetical protein
LATKRELIDYIRYQLDNLGAQNRHHDFEHVCRHLARLRIASNILPATGPVQGLGDQGRDAETFRTYLRENPLKGSSFVGLVAEGVVAFACTTQKDDVPAKIREDVQKIMASGIPVDSVHVFLVADFKAGVRHTLQAWAQEHFDLHLEIHDGQSISEMLTEPDVFWIASEFLSVPGEMFPKPLPTGGARSYLEILDAWRREPDRVPSFAHFDEVKYATRYATFSSEHRPDLPFWMDRLREFMPDGEPNELGHRAAYEIAVATLHEKQTLEGLEPLVRTYHDNVPSFTSASDLRDAAILLTFCKGARLANAVSFGEEEIEDWRRSIRLAIESSYSGEPAPQQRCNLLFVEGFLGMMEIGKDGNLNADGALEKWDELEKLIPKAQLFPLEETIDELIRFSRSKYFGILIDEPGFETLVHRLDAHFAIMSASSAMAQKSSVRARAYMENEHVLRGVEELQGAAIGSYCYETLEESIHSQLYLAEILLLELDLGYLAKHVSMAAAWVAGHSDKPGAEQYLPEAFLVTARCELMLGNWARAIRFLIMSGQAAMLYLSQSDDEKMRSVLNQVMMYIQHVLSLARAINTDLADRIQSRVFEGLGDSKAQENDRPVIPTEELTMDDVVDEFGGMLFDLPFSDLITERSYSWHANGIKWLVSCANEHLVNAAVEELIAVMQDFSLSLARHDAYIAPQEISLRVQLSPVSIPEVRRSDSMPFEWEVTLPDQANADPDLRVRMSHVIGVAAELAQVASLLPQDRYTEVITAIGKDEHQLERALVELPYRKLFLEMVDPDGLGLPEDSSFDLHQLDALPLKEPSQHPDLTWDRERSSNSPRRKR